MTKEYEGLSKRAIKLLSSDENLDVDWKKNIKGLHGGDIVAFANSKNGGSILVGVDEINDSEGKQTSKIIGCPITDNNKLQILSKAQNCLPPVDIEIIEEKTLKNSFYRLEIPSGPNKPYCTQKGEYKIRDDGNNKVLHPKNLLSIFLETESNEFINRFRKASEELETVLSNVSDDVIEAQMKLDDLLPSIDQLEDYAYLSDEILGKVNELEKEVGNIYSMSSESSKRIYSLIEHLKVEDPILIEHKDRVKWLINKDFKNGKELDKTYLKNLQNYYNQYKSEFIESCYNEYLKELNEK